MNTKTPEINLCGALLSDGSRCNNERVRKPGTGRLTRCCRQHNGGAPLGSQNALKHGYYTRAAKEERRRNQQAVHEMDAVLGQIMDCIDKPASRGAPPV